MSNITFKLEGIGQIEMVGTGPWRSVTVGSTYEIRDSEGRVANPTVHQRFSGNTTKPNRNVIFAGPMSAFQIVTEANRLFGEEPKSAPAAPGSETQVDG